MNRLIGKSGTKHERIYTLILVVKPLTHFIKDSIGYFCVTFLCILLIEAIGINESSFTSLAYFDSLFNFIGTEYMGLYIRILFAVKLWNFCQGSSFVWFKITKRSNSPSLEFFLLLMSFLNFFLCVKFLIVFVLLIHFQILFNFAFLIINRLFGLW